MTLPDEDDLLAGELALGLLDATEREGARQRAEDDPQFSAAVEAWRERFAPMLSPAVQPPVHLWPRIEARLAANDDAPLSPAERALRRWRAFAVAASAIAASLALVLVTRAPVEPPTAPTAAPTMIATLQAEGSPTVVTISADAAGRLLVTPVGLSTGEQVPELWIIPDDGTPRSLGVINAAAPSAVAVGPDQRVHLRQGATFAISQEPRGGSPTGSPTGPVIASGKISIV